MAGGRRVAAVADGFTLIELMIVIVVLGILAGITIFGVGAFRSDARNSACRTDVRTLATANAAYALRHDANAPDVQALIDDGEIGSAPTSGVTFANGVTTPASVDGCTGDELALTPDPPSSTQSLSVVASGTTFHGAVNDPAFDAHVTVTVTDEAHVVVEGAEVTGTWNDPALTHTACTTDVHGECTFTTTLSTTNPSVNVTWTLSAATKTGYALAPGSVTLRCSRQNNANDTRPCT